MPRAINVRIGTHARSIDCTCAQILGAQKDTGDEPCQFVTLLLMTCRYTAVWVLKYR